MHLSEEELALRGIIKSIDKLTAAIEQQNQLLKDVLYYPRDSKNPPCLLVGIPGPVEIFKS